ncbi:FG-GAP-like repeat-containing protein, partial [Flavobacteriaceae bacterium]|nr:FG-GAP-like repeat-containing protein [Flavobacteriaceae bacterium]
MKYHTLLLLLSFNIAFSNVIDESFLTNYTINVTASSSADYTLSGSDFNGTVSGNDPNLTFYVGDQITFAVNASNHPFYIKTVAGTGTGNQASNVTNNGTESGNVVWTPSEAGTYYYQCSAHAGMVGTITIISNSDPSVTSIVLDETTIAEHESFTITATIDAVHSKESIIPLTVTGTAELDTDYSVSFKTKGKAGVFHGGNGNGNENNQLRQPEGLALDSDGNLYIADYQNSRIQKVLKSNGEVNTIIDTSPVNPTDIHVDSSGNILVSMSGGGVLKYNSEGVFVDTVSTGMSGISAMHVDNNGDIYTVSNSNGKVWKATSSNSTASVLFEDDIMGFRNSIAVDSDGNVYVSGQNMMVRQWVKSTGEITYLDGESPEGYPYAGVGSGARAITINSFGNILIASDGGYSGKDENGLIPSTPATIWEYSLENGRINGESKIFTQDLTIQNYYMGISSVIEDSNRNLYLAIGKDANQSGFDFSDDNVKKDRVLFIRNQPSIVIPAGETTGLITFTGIEDDSYTLEDDENIIITPIESINVTNTFTDSKTVTLLNNSITVTRKDDPFIGLSKGSVSWGDFDRDGDKDVAIMGQSNVSGAITAIYENKDGDFVNTNQNFARLYDGDLSWVDINKDGYLDLVVSGYNKTPQTKVYLSKENATYFEPTEDYGLPQLFSTTMDWGDLDNDGDIDLAISGIDADENYVFDIYYRENGKDNFIKESSAGTDGWGGTGFVNGDLLIVDYDLDGDNDVLYSGEYKNGSAAGGAFRNSYFTEGLSSYNFNSFSNSSMAVYYEPNMKQLVISQIGSNQGGTVDSTSSSAMGIPIALKNGDISYADYNNDGYIDYVVSGEDDNGNPITKLFNGDWPSQSAEPTFSESSIELVGLRESTVNWVDYDMDGDLDLFLTGINSNGAQSILYETEIKNKKNKSPEKITGLEIEDLGYGKVKFKWDEPNDDFSSGGLGYILRIGTTPGGTELSNTLSNLETGERLISESPTIFNTYFQTQLDPGKYYFSVQAVDSGLKGSEFSNESSSIITYEWKELNQGGIVDKTIMGRLNPVLKLGDLDNDDDLDLIFGSSGEPTHFTDILKFDGSRLIKDNNDLLENNSFKNVELGDINGDGYVDVLINYYRNTDDNKLDVLLSNGSEGFTKINLDLGLYNAKLRILDLNNDGQSEISVVGVTNENSSGIPKFYIYEFEAKPDEVPLGGSFKEKLDLSDQIATLKSSMSDLGDIDKDGDIDFIISGFDESDGLLSYIYTNDTSLGGTFKLTKTNNNLVAVRDGTVDFIDFDSDGDLDAVFTGTGTQGDIFEIYRNDISDGKVNWPRIELGLNGMRNGKIDLGDFNGDGYVDLLYSGLVEGAGNVTKLAEFNSETNKFQDSDFDVSMYTDAEVEFGDIDGDGDLDFVLAGTINDENNESQQIFKAYLNTRNESAKVLENQDAGIPKQTSRVKTNSYVVNNPPSVPDGLTSKLVSDEVESGYVAVEFSWNASTDDLTKSSGLTYAIKVGATENGEEIMSSNANINGVRKTADKGNVEHNLSWKLSLPIGSYYWSIQAIDASYLGSSFSTSKSFLAGSDKDG